MNDPHWKILEQEMLKLQLAVPEKHLREKCITPKQANIIILTKWQILSAAILLIIASWSCYENVQQQQQNLNTYYIVHRTLDVEEYNKKYHLRKMFTKNKNIYSLQKSRLQWLQ
ncbi:hypothetical protein [Candidatus Uabimicrobium sp. HlEnr_7]|uniref:hypothetical protein n=1 Tax=Candidatus Uabimicrobium helgolandensis TaxID=3095367 RepID=UPI0035563732